MTSANISNLFAAAQPNMNLAEGTKVSASNQDFNEYFAKNLMVSPESEVKGAVAAPVAPKSNDFSVEAKKSQIKDAATAEEPKNLAEDVQKVEEAVSELEEKVTEVVADELDVSEEEVVKAMEVLGFTVLDLLDKSNLATLTAQLTGVENNVSVLLNDGFTNLSKEIEGLANDMLEQLSMTLEEVNTTLELGKEMNGFADVLANQMTTENTDAFSVNPEAAVADDTEAKEVVAESAVKPVEKQNEDEVPVEEAETETVEVKDITSMDKDEASKKDDNSKSFSNSESTTSRRTVSVNNDNNAAVFSGNEVRELVNEAIDEVELPTGQTVPTSEIMDQIVEQARAFVTEENATMEMILNPEGLGKVYMQVTQEKGGEITAKFFTTNEAVKEALESQMAIFKENINQQATKVSSIEVAVATHEFEQNLEEDQHRQEEEAQRREADRTSRRSIDLNNLDELSGLMTEEEQLVAQIMKDNGNSVNYKA